MARGCGRGFPSVEMAHSLTQQLRAMVCVQSVVKVTCNLLLVIAARVFLRECVQDRPYNYIAFTCFLMCPGGESSGIIQLS